jgi:hypothetical protein
MFAEAGEGAAPYRGAMSMSPGAEKTEAAAGLRAQIVGGKLAAPQDAVLAVEVVFQQTQQQTQQQPQQKKGPFTERFQ